MAEWLMGLHSGMWRTGQGIKVEAFYQLKIVNEFKFLTLCRSNSPIGILSIELHAVLDGKVLTLPSNTACSSLESIPIGLLDRQRVI